MRQNTTLRRWSRKHMNCVQEMFLEVVDRARGIAHAVAQLLLPPFEVQSFQWQDPRTKVFLEERDTLVYTVAAPQLASSAGPHATPLLVRPMASSPRAASPTSLSQHDDLKSLTHITDPLFNATTKEK